MALILKGDILYLHIPKTGGNWLTAMLHERSLVVEEVGHKHATYDNVCGIVAAQRNNAVPGSGATVKRPLRKGPALALKIARQRLGLYPSAPARVQVGGPPPGDAGGSPLDRINLVVCVVRHPLRWYESWFRYQSGRSWVHFGQNGSLPAWHPCSVLNDIDAPDFNTFMRGVNQQVPGFVSALYARYLDGSNATVLRNESLADDVAAFSSAHGLGLGRERLRGSGRIGESPAMTIQWDPDILAETIANERPALQRFAYVP